MKILHIATTLRTGGAERLIVDLLPLINNGENIAELLLFKYEDTFFAKQLTAVGIKIHYINIGEKNPLSIIRIRKFIKNYDIVHAHLVYPLYFVAIASIGIKINLVYTEHSTHNRRRNKKWLRPIEKYIYSKYNKIISISQSTQNALISWLQPKDKNIFVVINNGVNIDRFSTNKKTGNNKTLIMISRFVPAKDQYTVIKAMKYIDGATLTFVGDGEQIGECKLLTNKLNLQDRISFLGARNDISELLAESYIGIQSSFWEGFGLTAVEIMASGIPIVASNVDGLRQVVENAGLLFTQGDEKDLAYKVNTLLHNKDYYDTIVNRCVKRSKIYDIHNTAKNYITIYRELLNK